MCQVGFVGGNASDILHSSQKVQVLIDQILIFESVHHRNSADGVLDQRELPAYIVCNSDMTSRLFVIRSTSSRFRITVKRTRHVLICVSPSVHHVAFLF